MSSSWEYIIDVNIHGCCLKTIAVYCCEIDNVITIAQMAPCYWIARKLGKHELIVWRKGPHISDSTPEEEMHAKIKCFPDMDLGLDQVVDNVHVYMGDKVTTQVSDIFQGSYFAFNGLEEKRRNSGFKRREKARCDVPPEHRGTLTEQGGKLRLVLGDQTTTWDSTFDGNLVEERRYQEVSDKPHC